MRLKRYNLGHNIATTMDAGYLIPVDIIEMVPGDMFTMRWDAFLRAAPLNRPLMHNVRFDMRAYFVPNRLVWTNWEAFRNGEAVGSIPTITLPALASCPVVDYMGVEVVPGQTISALPVRAYNAVVNKKFYEALTDYVTPRLEDDVTLAKAMWARDYFTAARTAPQLGAASTIPLAFTASRLNIKADVPNATVAGNVNANIAMGGTGAAPRNIHVAHASFSPTVTNEMYVDLTGLAAASGIAISDLRRSIKAQEWSELRKRIGDDYVDWLRAVGVSPQDVRVREPEFIGGARKRVAFSEILSTADSGAYDVGEMAGHGIATLSSKPMRYLAREDGFIVVVANVTPEPVYAGGVPRMFRRSVEADYWSPQREGIGDQPIYNYELRAGHASPNGIFGYTDRFRDYMELPDRVTGELRQGIEYPTWHWARMFSSDPALNAAFVQADPSNRVWADTNTDNFIVQFGFDISALRPIRNDEVL